MAGTALHAPFRPFADVAKIRARAKESGSSASVQVLIPSDGSVDRFGSGWKADICSQLHPAPWSSHLAIVRVAGPATGNWQVRGHRREVRRHDQAARPLLMRAVAIGDCHGQELNRRNLHDPALSPAQVEPRPRGVAVARRQTKGLENGIPDWKSVSLVQRARKYPRAPHAGIPRRRSHASRHRPHPNGISLPAHVRPGKRARCGRRRSSETPDRTP